MRLFLPSSLKVAVPLLLLVFAALLSTVNLIYTVPQAERAVEDKAQVRLFQELSGGLWELPCKRKCSSTLYSMFSIS
jgi:hypothetical protein